jgi:hypothetical protein
MGRQVISAKDYYYTKISPKELGMNYQQAHHGESADKSLANIYSHVPKRSNDILIEGYVEELISASSSGIAERLEKTFIAKHRDFFPQAGARHSQSEYDGDLIIFNVGLSDVLFQYAILFQQFKNLVSAFKECGEWSSSLAGKFSRFCVDLEKISEAHIEWGINQNEIRFNTGFYIEPEDDVASHAAAIATFMDKAIVRHEISHHLLGHTELRDEISTELLGVVNNLIIDEAVSPQQRRELEADICSLLIPISGKNHDIESIVGTQIEVCLGTLLMQTVLAQLKSDIHLDSKSHPSWKIRHSVMLKVVNETYGSNMLNQISNDVVSFQKLLYMSQGRGLGVLHGVTPVADNFCDDENVMAISKAVMSCVVNA